MWTGYSGLSLPAALCPLPGSASLGWRPGWSTHLGLWGRFAGLREDHDTGTLKCSGALWVTEDRPSESASPVASREQACSAGQVSRLGLASRTGHPLCSQAWPQSSSVARTAQGKKRKRGNKNSVAQVFCVTADGLRGAQAQPRGLLVIGGGLRDLADGFGSGWGRLATRRRDTLLDLLGPLHVVRSGLLARQALDEVLQASPEAYHLQGVVEPACGDTEVCLMGCHMVDAMVFPWQDHVPVLQDSDPAW